MTNREMFSGRSYNKTRQGELLPDHELTTIRLKKQTKPSSNYVLTRSDSLSVMLYCYILLSEISFYHLFTIPVHFSKSRKFLTDLLLKNTESFLLKSFKYLKYFSNHGRIRAPISDMIFYSLGCQAVTPSDECND